MTCRLCRDEIYDGEAAADGRILHAWCAVMDEALTLCMAAMATRRARGLPTPTAPTFRDPHRPPN